MSTLEFILGGAGAGKTTLFCEEIIDASIREPEKQFLVIVPEQFTLQTQLDFVRLHPNHGILNIDVLSFERLAHRIFEETGSDALSVLRDTGKTLLLRRAAEELADELTVFGRNFRQPGYAAEMKSLLSEFGQYQLGPEEVHQLQEQMQGHDLLSQKLSDIEKLQRKFYELLGNDFITGEQLLEKLAEVLPKSAIVQDAVIALDGFTGFTPIQLTVLEELMRKADRVLLTLTMEEPPMGLVSKQSLFFLEEICMKQMLSLAEKMGSKIQEPTILKRPYPRFRKVPEIAHLEEHLFRAPVSYYEDVSHISIHQNRTPKEEASFVATSIAKLIMEGARYRDVAVIVSDMNQYADYLSLLFEEWKIPYFMDQKRDILQNTFVELMRSMLGLIEEAFSYEAVIRYMKCSLSGWEDADIFLLENYLLATGISGFSQWNHKWMRIPKGMKAEDWEKVNALRERFLEEIDTLVETFGKAGKKHIQIREATKCLYHALLEKNLQVTLDGMSRTFEEQGLLSLSKEYGQIYHVVMDLFDQFVLLLGEENITAREYRELLESGLSDARVGIVPPGRDQVVVGNLERTRLSEVKYVFFMGVNDHLLPGQFNGGGILTDRERRFLSEQDVSLAPGTVEKIGIKRFYLYFMLAKPTEHLYLSYSAVDMDGKALRPSGYLRDLFALFPALASNIINEKEHELDRGIDRSRLQAIRFFARGLREELFENASWQTIYRFLQEEEEGREISQELIRERFLGQEIAPLSRDTTEILYGTEMQASASKLETFAKCPHQYFLRYALRLSERDLFSFDPLDEGLLMHDSLYRYGKRVEEMGISWSDVSKHARKELVQTVLAEAEAGLSTDVLSSTARLSFVRNRLEKKLDRTVWALSNQIKAGMFSPYGYEISFGKHGERGVLLSEGDERLRLIGTIDRLDVALPQDEKEAYLRIFDYKTGSKKIDLNAIYQGMDLQLLVYLALSKQFIGERIPERKPVPAGIFLYHVDDPVLERGDIRNTLESSLMKALVPDGLWNDAPQVLPLLDRNFADPDVRSSEVIQMKRKKTQEPDAYSQRKMLSTEEFQSLEDHLSKMVLSYGKRIMEGDIRQYPARDKNEVSCKFCAYRSICSFSSNKPGCKEHIIPSYDVDTIKTHLRKEEEDA